MSKPPTTARLRKARTIRDAERERVVRAADRVSEWAYRCDGMLDEIQALIDRSEADEILTTTAYSRIMDVLAKRDDD